MLATRRPPLRSPVRLRRGVAAGSLLGVGMLVAAASTGPAALADEGDATPPEEQQPEETPVPAEDVLVVDPAEGQIGVAQGQEQETVALQPVATLAGDYGYGKSLAITVAPPAGTAPKDLDLSETKFALSSGATRFECSTTPQGVCGFSFAPGAWGPASFQQVIPGTYTLTQTAVTPGLEMATGQREVTICGLASGCDDVWELPVVNTSLFRTEVAVSATEAGTTTPARGATYALTGPGYRLQGGTSGGVDYGTKTTGEDGTATFAGEDVFFPPAAGYALNLVPAPLVAGPAAPFTILTPVADASSPRSMVWPAWELTPTVPRSPETSGDTDPDPVDPAPEEEPAPAPAPQAVPSSVAPQVAPAAPGAARSAAPTSAPASTPTLPSWRRPTADGSSTAPLVTAQDDAPKQLQTVSSSVSEVTVIGFGLAFLAAVIAALGIMGRRRARRR
jgi:hypothetical protein